MKLIFQPTNNAGGEIPSSTDFGSGVDSEEGLDPEESLPVSVTPTTQASPWTEQSHPQTVNPSPNVIHIVNFAISLQSDVTPGQPELLLELNPDEHVLQEARVHDEVPRGRDQSMGTITCTCHVSTNCPEPCVCPSTCSHCQRLGRARESMGNQDHRRRRR